MHSNERAAWAMRQTDLPPAARCVLHGIVHHDHGKNGGWVWPSRETIAEVAGVSVATVKRYIPALISAGKLETRVRPGMSTEYRAVYPGQSDPTTRVNLTRHPGQSDPTTRVNLTHEQKEAEKKERRDAREPAPQFEPEPTLDPKKPESDPWACKRQPWMVALREAVAYRNAEMTIGGMNDWLRNQLAERYRRVGRTVFLRTVDCFLTDKHWIRERWPPPALVKQWDEYERRARVLLATDTKHLPSHLAARG